MTDEPDLGSRVGVPFRRYAAFWFLGVAVVGGALLVYSVLTALATVLALVAVAAFFAVVLSPVVDLMERRVHLRRGVATLAVFLLGLVAFGGLVYVFASPVYDASSSFSQDLPRTIRDAEHGRGEIGHWLRDIGAQRWARQNLPKLRDSLTNTNGLLAAGRSVVTGTIATLTVLVLTFLMLLEGPSIGAFLVELFPDPRAEHLRRVASDAARAVTGYMAGNLLISLIAGTAIFLWLLATGLQYALVLSLWVAFADMLPLVGATLGAIPAIFVAFLASPGLGIATIVFFVVYQLFENHVLQTTIMAKTVRLNPLVVLLAVLAGVELAGLLGALLAIPVVGALQVVARDVWRDRRRVVEDVLSIGADVANAVDGDDDVPRDAAAHPDPAVEASDPV
ncbi:MAG: AI-2E family transporter [Acidimicrobiia bacterium]